MISLSTIAQSDYLKGSLPCAFFAFEEGGLVSAAALTPAQRKELTRLAGEDDFKGKAGECVRVPLEMRGASRRFVIVGLGKKKDFSNEALRRAAGSLYQATKNLFPKLAVAAPAAAPAAEGLLLASYSFDEYRKPTASKLTEACLVVDTPTARKKTAAQLAHAALTTEAVCLARDLVNRAPSDKAPKSLAGLAQKMGGIKVSVVDHLQAKSLGMGSFLGVARGNSVDPVFLHLIYKPKGAKKKIGLVGKGITFDSGGLSLKPPASMETMKMDMAGAAVVLGVFSVLPRFKVRVEVHGFCPVTYNMPGPDAVKPGDVLKAMNGKTIEVLNTDAEGRLVLADALVYAERQKLDAIIDLATLTGAVVVALGSKVTGAMTNNKPLLERLLASSRRTGEITCELPLLADYKEGIKSSIADIQNIGKVRGEAGAIIGGLFLQEFVESTPWVHLDIAGTAWSDAGSSYVSKGGTGAYVRTLLDYLGAL